MKAKKNHYLVVADKDNRIEILNCSQETHPSDTLITELLKDDWYNILEIANDDGIEGTLRGEPVETFRKYYDIYFNERYNDYFHDNENDKDELSQLLDSLPKFPSSI